jgi:hypothetical protein
MLSRRSIVATALAAVLGMVGSAQAFDGPKYPEWEGHGGGSSLLNCRPTVPARRSRVGTGPNLGDWDNKRR